ncbi:hypothetical protein EXT65_21000 [Pectobacterium carotovorum subsp. carotovorum]|nr:hypothetical protein [Pectobacterium carotovorum]MCL6336274.1 hypothetical protein [Pectobacterium carotovorum subsp. carotovorum]
MTAEIDLFDRRFIESVEQTMLLMTKSSKSLTSALAKNVVLKVNATALDGQFPQAIYRAKRAYAKNRSNIIHLAGLYSQLFAQEKNSHLEAPFSIIVNIDHSSLKDGFIWYSPEKNKSYRISDLDYYTLDKNIFEPYSMSVRK